jgi:transcriptional regulator with GAF, ATPase, and Fis domain
MSIAWSQPSNLAESHCETPRRRPHEATARADATVEIRALGVMPRRAILEPGRTLLVGTAPDVGLVLADPAVAAHHCLLRHQGQAIEIEDIRDPTVHSKPSLRIGSARVRWAELPLCATFEVASTTVCIGPPPTDGATIATMVGRCPAMRALGELIVRVAGTSLPVLLRGETGTGKELAARAIHESSDRARGPFVAINGATAVSGLGLSLLFGHVAGAFTGAREDRLGAFREAHGGTLFLDEIAALPAEAQAALLRVIEEGLVVPVGADRGTRVDVRIVAATCEPLEQRASTGAFRNDLYQRLSVCRLEIPPLRERRADIPLLVTHLLASSELRGCSIEDGAVALLRKQPLPGNVRELRNLLLQAALRCHGRTIRKTDVAMAIASRRPEQPILDARNAREIVALAGGNISAAARRAGLPRSTFRDILFRADQAANSDKVAARTPNHKRSAQ